MAGGHYIDTHEMTDSADSTDPARAGDPFDPGGLADDEVDDGIDGVVEAPATEVWTIGPEHGGWRLDRAVAARLPSLSRSRLQAWIDAGAARVNEGPARVRQIVYEGDRIRLDFQPMPESSAYGPEPMQLDIVHEDEVLLILDKPPGLVVHPGAGNWSGTLLNGLLAYQAALAAVPRAGIVHRLDAGTSGLMAIAKTGVAQLELARQLQAREMGREYWAVVTGEVPAAGTIDAPLARDPRNPLRFRVSAASRARDARTQFRRIAFRNRKSARVGSSVSWVACRLDTGRTHQIRVHLESIGHPLIGDPMYARHRPALSGAALSLTRQALHACRLSLVHPVSGMTMSWFRRPPADLSELMEQIGFDIEHPVDAFGLPACA